MVMRKSAFYKVLQRIEDDSNLAYVFNEALRSLEVIRICSSPTTFEKAIKDEGEHCADLFYETCLWEMYLHSVISKLHEWEDGLNEYFNEFEGSWRYYASSKRIECIREYGGDEQDYDDEGNIRTMNLTDKELEVYTIINDLMHDDWKDIVQETKPEHLNGLCAALQTQAKISITDILKNISGAEIDSYKTDEVGNMVRMTFADKVLMKASDENKADDLSVVILFVCNSIQIIIEKIKSLSRFNDNKNELSSMYKDIGFLLSMDFRSMGILNDFLRKKDIKKG